MWHVSSRSGAATLRTTIHLLLTYLQSIQPSDMHTLAFAMSAMIYGIMSIVGYFLANTKSLWILTVRYLSRLCQQMLTADKHVAEDNYVFQQDSALTHHACNSQTAGEHTLSLTSFYYCPSVNS